MDLAFDRPSAGAWYVLKSEYNFLIHEASARGASTDTPLAADCDGDGLTDYAVLQRGIWKGLLSTSGFTTNLTVSQGARRRTYCSAYFCCGRRRG
jgi:hypothetical protein